MRKHKTAFLAIGLLVTMLFGMAALTGCSELEEQFYPRKFSEIVEKEAKENGVEEALIYAVIKAESGFDQYCVSDAGAVGLMQVMPETVKWLVTLKGDEAEEDEGDLTEDELCNAELNIHYGTYYLKYLQKLYKDSDVATIAAAYNAGHGAVDEWLEDPDCSDDGVNLKQIPYAETAAYSKKVTRYYEKYKELYY